MDDQAPANGPFPGDGGWGLEDHFARLVREIDAGRMRPPPECDVDTELLATTYGQEGLGGEALSAAFGQDGAADVLPPGPVLASLTAQAVAVAGSLADDELVGVLQAARRLANLAACQQTVVIAEFACRRHRFEYGGPMIRLHVGLESAADLI